jgi:hypothetical protein
MSEQRLRFAQLITIFALTVGARADVIDFEGIAPTNSNTTETGTRILGDYYLQQNSGAHGHITDSVATVSIPGFTSNGTDWYWHHHFNPFQIGRVDNTGFDLTGFDATDYWEDDGSQSLALTLTGYYIGGGTITQVLTTDTLAGFETITLGSGWSNLHHVTFAEVSGVAAFDNIGLAPHTPLAVADNGSIASLLIGTLVALAAVRLRWRSAF